MCLNILETEFKEITSEKLENIFQEVEKDNYIQLTKVLIEFNTELHQLIKQKLGNSILFHKGKVKAFLPVIHKTYKTPWLAEYWDLFLRTEAGTISDEDLAKAMESFLLFFKLIAEKDEFVSYYFWHQTNRYLDKASFPNLKVKYQIFISQLFKIKTII